ncbi:MAG TPA: peptidoglycan bridge formation glycyltransferase FemA/FemB family protein [Candidatus Saccharimonadales bacterium]|nr:peptidoglycan bridge formation glycyltransferase FemA/FemB family protein [Candidatus Saccharimonadales bacterium]
MTIDNVNEAQKEQFNTTATHPLQTYEWGEFRKKTGIKVIRRAFVEDKKILAGFQQTIHKVPKLHYNIGYLPKGFLPTEELLGDLYTIGKENKCIFIQLEPNVTVAEGKEHMDLLIRNSKFLIRNSHRPLFTKYTFQLDLTKSEEELLKNMHPKTRYNIKVAQKHNVQVAEDNSDESFNTYWHLTEETTKRQKFFAHTKKYHELMWETLKQKSANQLQAHLLCAKYTPEAQKEPVTLAAWILFSFHDTLYYPYGASSTEYKNVMASNLMMWEAIKFGKKMGLKTFDMWGSMGENPDTTDPWYGFHRLKQGYGPTLVEFVGSYDLVINPYLYQLYKTADKLRWMMLRKK